MMSLAPLLLALPLVHAPAQDAGATPPSAPPATLEDLLHAIDWSRAIDGIGAAQGRLERLLEGLSIRPVILSDSSANSDGTTLGLEYDVQKDLAKPLVVNAKKGMGLALQFFGRGTIALEEDQNPRDFLETGLSLNLFGRFTSMTRKAGELETRARAGDAEARLAYQELRVMADKKIAQISTDKGMSFADAVNSKAYREFLSENPEAFVGQHTWWTWHADLKANLETNQAFTERQGAFGLRLGGTGFSDDPSVVGWNLLDYPFAVTRWLTGEKSSDHLAKYFPRITLGLDLVDPIEDGSRELSGEDLDPFTRFSAEVGFVTRFGTIDTRRLKASLDWRFFKELGSSDEVEDADLDQFDSFAATLTDEGSGVFFSYSTGRLPLDPQDDDVFALGWGMSR